MSGPLTDSPFTSLRNRIAGDLPPGPGEDPGEQASAAGDAAPCLFRVGRTRKGGWPVRLEKRSGGKLVTVLDRVEGDAQALLTALRRRCGAGGAVRNGSVELQGDQRAKLEAFLREL